MFVFTGSMAGPVSKTLVEIIQSWIFHRDPLSIFTASIIPMLCWKQGRLRAERGRVIESLLESLLWIQPPVWGRRKRRDYVGVAHEDLTSWKCKGKCEKDFGFHRSLCSSPFTKQKVLSGIKRWCWLMGSMEVLSWWCFCGPQISDFLWCVGRGRKLGGAFAS